MPDQTLAQSRTEFPMVSQVVRMYHFLAILDLTDTAKSTPSNDESLGPATVESKEMLEILGISETLGSPETTEILETSDRRSMVDWIDHAMSQPKSAGPMMLHQGMSDDSMNAIGRQGKKLLNVAEILDRHGSEGRLLVGAFMRAGFLANHLCQHLQSHHLCPGPKIFRSTQIEQQDYNRKIVKIL